MTCTQVSPTQCLSLCRMTHLLKTVVFIVLVVNSFDYKDETKITRLPKISITF